MIQLNCQKENINVMDSIPGLQNVRAKAVEMLEYKNTVKFKWNLGTIAQMSFVQRVWQEKIEIECKCETFNWW